LGAVGAVPASWPARLVIAVVAMAAVGVALVYRAGYLVVCQVRSGKAGL
jgi:hypothetical protein